MIAAVTGWAWRTALGSSVDRAVARLLAGERAAVPMGRHFGCRIAGEPAPSRHERFLPRMALLGVEAAKEAAANARVREGDRLGVFAGAGGMRVDWEGTLPALERQHQDGAGAWARGLGSLHPFWLLRHLSNNAHSLLSADLAARGEGASFGGAIAGGEALAAALRALEAGAVDAAVVFAYDSLLAPECHAEAVALGTPPAEGPRLAAPYDVEAKGHAPGEAAVALVVEPRAAAGSRALALVEATSGADGEVSEPRAETIARAVARIAHGETVVDGAAMARPRADVAERNALSGALRPDAALTATSSAAGRVGAAGPLLQLVAVASALRQGLIPPIAGLSRPADAPLRPVVRAEKTTARSAIAVSVGAPGLCCAIRLEVP